MWVGEINQCYRLYMRTCPSTLCTNAFYYKTMQFHGGPLLSLNLSDLLYPLSSSGFEFFEASAKDNINVKQTFERLVDIICEKMSESLDAGDPAVTGAKQGPQLTEQPAPPHQDCAC